MSRKQEIYSEILFWALPYIRNVQSQGWFRRACDRSCYFETQFVHRLPDLILEPEFSEQDVDFLNFHARYYFDHAKHGLCPNSPAHRPLVVELMHLVPERLKESLTWPGPGAAAFYDDGPVKPSSS